MDAPQQLGKYTLVRHLATGGMAEIYLAEQAGPGGFNKELVIKRILPHMAQDEAFVRMFLDEARLVAQLSHPKIAQIYDLGEIDGQYFIAMEFVDGLDLMDVIEGCRGKGEHVPVFVAVKIVMDLLEALDYAHDYTDREGNPVGLVHRDISPHNVLVSVDGIVKLVDFGVAKAAQNKSKTQAGAVKGKFAYMAPEQIQSQELDRRADIFATGILLYETLTEQKPFGDDLNAVTNILTQPHPDPRTIRPEIPAQIVAILDRALSKDREQRYHDAHEMVRDLEAFARSSPEYVGDRELAAFVRSLRGLPTTRHSSQGELAAAVTPGPQARITPMETGTPIPDNVNVHAATMATPSVSSFEQAQAAGMTAPQSHQGSPTPSQPMPTAEVNSVQGAQLPDGNTVGIEAYDAPDEGVSAGLVAVFVVLLLGIVGAGGGAFFLLVSGDDGTDGTTPNAETTVAATTAEKPAEPKGNPSLMQDPSGVSVTINAVPNADIYLDDELVGTTPFSAKLKPGDYKIELRAGKKRKFETFNVKPGKFFQSVRFKL